MSGEAATALAWFQASAAPVAVLGPTGSVDAAAPGFAEALGAPISGLVGHDLVAMVAPLDRDAVASAVTAVAAIDPVGQAPPPPVGLVASGWVPGALPFRAHFRLSPVPGGGAVVALVERCGPPISTTAVEHVDNDRSFDDQIAGALSHDVRASLRSVNGFLGLVERSAAIQEDETARKHLRTSRDAGAAADNGVEALVRLMRIHGRVLTVRPVSLDAVLDKGVQRSLEVLPGPAPTLNRPSTPQVLLADPLLVGELLGELFTNSRKFGGDAVRITVTATLMERWLHLTVADDGPGVSPDLADDAFRLFRLLQPKGRFPGVGMGLPLARAIAESHAGTISLEHRDGAGAVVHLILPAGTDHA